MSDINFAEPLHVKEPIYKKPLFWGVIVFVVVIAIVVAVVVMTQPAQQNASSSSTSSSASVESSLSVSTEVSSVSSSALSDNKLRDSNGKLGVDYFTDEEIKSSAEAFGMTDEEMRRTINEVNASITDDALKNYLDKGVSVEDARAEVIASMILLTFPMSVDETAELDTSNMELQPGVGIDAGNDLFISLDVSEEVEGGYTIAYDNSEGKSEAILDYSQWAALDEDKKELFTYDAGVPASTIGVGQEIERVIQPDKEVVFIQFKGNDTFNGCLWRIDGKE